MIKANELRIGNYVIIKNYNSKYWNKIGIIEGFSRNAEYVSLDINKYSSFYLKDIEPIPLTEEILLKCRFIKDKESDNGFFLKVNNDWSDIYIDVVYGYCEIVVNKHSLPIPLLYVHQLQNLIFSLTQKELTIQL